MLELESVSVSAPTLVSELAPETMPDSVMLPVPPTEEAAAKATEPDSVAAAAALLVNAPALLTPVPLKLKLLAMLLPFKSKAAPEATVALPVPKAAELPTTTVPALMAVLPE